MATIQWNPTDRLRNTNAVRYILSDCALKKLAKFRIFFSVFAELFKMFFLRSQIHENSPYTCSVHVWLVDTIVTLFDVYICHSFSLLNESDQIVLVCFMEKICVMNLLNQSLFLHQYSIMICYVLFRGWDPLNFRFCGYDHFIRYLKIIKTRFDFCWERSAILDRFCCRFLLGFWQKNCSW